MKYFAFFFMFISINYLYGQDSVKNNYNDSIPKINLINNLKTDSLPFDSNVIKETSLLNSFYEIFSYQDYIWSDKRTISEVLQSRNGYRVYNSGFGQNNFIIFKNNNLDYFKDGIDIFSFDTEILPVNEIDKVQEISYISSALYTDYPQSGLVNIITKDYIQPEPFSQLRYSQDRYGSLSADIYYSQSFSKKFNIQFGISNSSTDGRYENSNFSRWTANTRINYMPNPNLNIKSNFNFAKIDRGMFGGLINDSSETVVNDTAKYNRDYYTINAGIFFKPFKNKNNLSKILLSYQRSGYDRFVSENSSPNLFYTDIYSIILNQTLNFKLKSFDISYLEFYTSFKRNQYSNSHSDNINSFSRLELRNDKINLSGFLKLKSRYDIIDNSGFLNSGNNIDWSHTFIPGIEIDYTPYKTNNFRLKLFGGINYFGRKYPDNQINSNFSVISGVGVNVGELYIKLELTSDVEFNRRGSSSIDLVNQFVFYEYGNYQTNVYSAKLKYNFNNFHLDLANDFYPYSDGNVNLLNSNLFYSNKLFKEKLDLKTGVIFKYYSGFEFKTSSENDFTIKRNVYQLDFYVGARIGSANVSFTLANLFNRFNFDNYLYPYDDRGGLLNVVSRFTIVWDFLN